MGCFFISLHCMFFALGETMIKPNLFKIANITILLILLIQNTETSKRNFLNILGISKGFGMAQALQQLGLELKGTHHRGIDDARNIAAIFRHMNTKKSS